MLKKIGVLTQYYNSINYGGLLQSYALVRYINDQSFKAEQICFELSFQPFGGQQTTKQNRFFKYFNPLNYYFKLKNSIINMLISKNMAKLSKNMAIRGNTIMKFREKIIHSDRIYSFENIKDSNEHYDIFITGSDQVWNLDWFNPTYFLEFANKNKKRISYAASVGHSKLREDRIDYFKKVLPTFDAISVREKDSVDLLQPLTDKRVEWVLDPTLLLDKKDWDEICPERRIKEKYLFCYFLGHDKSIRKLAKQYAKKHNLKIVNLPHLTDFCKADVRFGHYKLYDVAPNDFISLIKYSECVFTDSFHACVFSGIYNKNFYVFNRSGMESMATRLYSLCELFECQDHFCDTDDKFSLDYIDSLSPINYNKEFKLFHEMKEKSINFLLSSLRE